MRNRLYFITYAKLAEMLTLIPIDTIEDLCRKGEITTVKFGRTVLIPTICLRQKYPQLPIEFWQEICEDIYRELDGTASYKMRLERRRNGKNPSTGEDVSKLTLK